MKDLERRVLSFWFGKTDVGVGSVFDASRLGLWFRSDASVDETIRRDFVEDIKVVASNKDGIRDSLETTSSGILTAIILLDQFPRNCFRGTPAMFQYDSDALRLATRLISKGWDRSLGLVQRVFAYLPFEHAEDLRAQETSLRLFQGLQDEYAGSDEASHAANFLRYAQEHAEIVREFGRFPHRNAILGRPSTAAEEAYLANGGKTF